MKRLINIAIVLMIPLALAVAWVAGEQRTESAILAQIANISSDISDLTPLGEGLYRAQRANSKEPLYVALDVNPSYGGPLTVATVINGQQRIEHVAILQSADTSSYLEKIVGLGILRAFTSQPVAAVPQVDTISGATISSTAIIRGVEQTANRIGVAAFGMQTVAPETRSTTPETVKLVTVLLFFAAAAFVASKRFPWDRKKSRAALMVASVVTMGFTFGVLISLSTVVTLISGNWIAGLATYAPLFCLVLALVAILFMRKNLYCTYICPFGALQEGLGKITGCKAPARSGWMLWLTRTWVFVLLLATVYFHAPSDAIYEPFGKAFNFIGSATVYGLTILVVISSLFFNRPWCRLFCPATVLFDYFTFARKAFAPKPRVVESVLLQSPIQEVEE
jgi:uncharacterized protein with FMN-binding domain